MKKMIILTGLLVTMLTGCGNMEEANEVETKSTVDTVCEEAIETSEELVEECENYLYLTEDEFDEMMADTIAYIKEDYIEEGVSEECAMETIELIESIEYDPSFEYCYDYESLMKDYIRILLKYDLIPEEYKDLTVDELYEGIV